MSGFPGKAEVQNRQDRKKKSFKNEYENIAQRLRNNEEDGNS